MDQSKLLIDRFVFKPHLIEDNRKTGGKVVARGEFARADLATENKRVYPRALWERELKRLEKQIDERKVYGELDHPMDGRTQLKRVSHLITRLHMEGSVLIGEAHIMDTAEGRNLKAILDAGGMVGVSSRGFGTTRPNQEGIDVVQDDYRLMTFDFVADPANTTSYPSVHVEDKKVNTVAEAFMEDKMTLDKLRQEYPKLYENFRDEAEREFEKRGAEIWAKKISAASDLSRQQTTTDLRSTFAENLKQAIETAKAELAEQERERLLNDPTVAGAKKALESVRALLRPFVMPEDVEAVVSAKEKDITDLTQKLAEAELRIANISKENEKLESLAKEAGYLYHVEKLLHDVPHAELIRKSIGDVKRYESLEALNNKIGEVVDEIKKVTLKQEERDTEISRLREENEKYKLAAEKALEATKLMAVNAYLEERLKNHPRASEVRALVESRSSTTKADVDNVLSQFREPARDPEAINEARAKVRALVGSTTKEYLQENEERPRGANDTRSRDYNGLGQTADTLRTLSGMGTDNN